MMEDAPQLDIKISTDHYENFPVAPFFLPKKIREPIRLIYSFARYADDIADEGNHTDDWRLAHLQAMQDELSQIEQKQSPQTEFFQQLKVEIDRHSLPVQLFRDLLIAFAQDATKNRYQTFDEVMDYCKHSANPIGRLLLHLTHNDTSENLKNSDKICSALQLINFWQDIEPDFRERNRIYIPLDDLVRFGVSESDFQNHRNDKAMQDCVSLQWQRAATLLNEGAHLCQQLKGLLGLEIRLTVHGGNQILRALQKRSSPFERPVLKKYDWLQVILSALLKRPVKQFHQPQLQSN